MQIGDRDPDLRQAVRAASRSVFGSAIRFYEDRHSDRDDASVSVRFSSSKVIRFLERNGLRKEKAADLRVPQPRSSPSPPAVRAAFLAGLFEADGHVANGYPHLSTVSTEFHTRDVHRLLLSIGIPSRVHRIDDRRTAFGQRPVHVVRVVSGEGVRRFAKLVGFVSERKSTALQTAVDRKDASPFESQWHLPHVVEELDRGVDRHERSAAASSHRSLLQVPSAAQHEPASSRVLLERVPTSSAERRSCSSPKAVTSTRRSQSRLPTTAPRSTSRSRASTSTW